MSTEAIIYINHSLSDSPLETAGVDWISINTDEGDALLFNEGSNVLIDNANLPGESEITRAGFILNGSDHIIEKCFLLDVSASKLKEVFMACGQNKRYVFAVDFDGDTVSEPVLEAWDDVNMNTADSVILGSGTPALSWVQAICTTDGVPGVAWVTGVGDGVLLSGASDGYFLNLNSGNGALGVAKTLYFQLKIVVPSSQENSGLLNPNLVIKWTSL